MASLSDFIHMMDFSTPLPGRRAGGAGLNPLEIGQIIPNTNRFNPSQFVKEWRYLNPQTYMPEGLTKFLREPGDGMPGWIRGLFDPQKALTLRIPGLDPLGKWIDKKL